MTRSVRDSAALLDATSGPVAGDPYWPAPPVDSYLSQVTLDPSPMRIAWSARAPLGMPVDPECRKAVEATAKRMEALGHHVVEDDPNYDEEVLLDPMVTIWSVGNATDHDIVASRIGRAPRRDELEITTWELVERGRGVSATQLVRAVDLIHAATRDMAPFFKKYDAWLTPTLSRPPLPLGVLNQSYGGAEIGILFTGRYGDEAGLFRLAGQLERAHGWADRVAP